MMDGETKSKSFYQFYDIGVLFISILYMKKQMKVTEAHFTEAEHYRSSMCVCVCVCVCVHIYVYIFKALLYIYLAALDLSSST